MFEFEPSSDDTVCPKQSRRRTLLTAVLPDVSETVHLFRTIYDQLELPVDVSFHTMHGDCKALSIATGVSTGVDMSLSVCEHMSLCLCVWMSLCVFVCLSVFVFGKFLDYL